jgi:TPR repeat protein
MPLVNEKIRLFSCCSKTICDGCDHVHRISNKQQNCPFCREPVPDREHSKKRKMKRIKAGDPVAMVDIGQYLSKEGDYNGAVQYFTKAAELGDVEAHYELALMYEKGKGVEKDEGKAVYHYERAAIGGDPYARNNLGCIEEENGRFDRAVKHFVIAANLGNEESMRALWGHYKQGLISKEDLEATLRAHQAAVDAMKSPERAAAAAHHNKKSHKVMQDKNGDRKMSRM